MSRLQLALNVSDLDEAIDFYSKYFKTQPAKVRAGLRQLRDRRAAAQARADGGRRTRGPSTTSASRSSRPTRWPRRPATSRSQGLATEVEDQTTCCYAVQDKVWVDGPDGTQLGDLRRPRRRRGEGSGGERRVLLDQTPAGAARCC